MKQVYAVSPDFTIDDIHKIREFHYEMTKSLSVGDRRRRCADPEYSREVDERNRHIAELVHAGG